MFSSISCVYPLDASSMPPFPFPPVVTTEVSPDIAKCLMGGAKSSLVENHCSNVFNKLNIKMLYNGKFYYFYSVLGSSKMF